MSAANEVTQHALGNLEVGDHATLHRPDSFETRRGTAEILKSSISHCHPVQENGVRTSAYRNNRRLVYYDAMVTDTDKGVRGTEIDAQIL
jgi:hypothetical protein